MEKILLFFMQGIPEVTGIVAFGLALVRVPLRWGIVTATGTVLTVIIYVVRSVQITFGIHMVMVILLLAIFIIKTTQITAMNGFFAAIASFTTLATMEWVINKLFLFITKLDQQVFVSNELLWKLVGLPQAILMILFALIISKYKAPDRDAWRI